MKKNRRNPTPISFKDFREDVLKTASSYPFYIRKGQAVFNVIHRKYGNIAYEVMKKDATDCFYNDRNTELFIELAYKRLIDNEGFN